MFTQMHILTYCSYTCIIAMAFGNKAMSIHSSCVLWGCKNRACSVSWSKVIKGVPNQGVVYFVSYGSFLVFPFLFTAYVVFCFLVCGGQYQYNRLPGKTCLWNDLLCVEWHVKLCTLTHSHVCLFYCRFCNQLIADYSPFFCAVRWSMQNNFRWFQNECVCPFIYDTLCY